MLSGLAKSLPVFGLLTGKSDIPLALAKARPSRMSSVPHRYGELGQLIF